MAQLLLALTIWGLFWRSWLTAVEDADGAGFLQWPWWGKERRPLCNTRVPPFLAKRLRQRWTEGLGENDGEDHEYYHKQTAKYREFVCDKLQQADRTSGGLRHDLNSATPAETGPGPSGEPTATYPEQQPDGVNFSIWTFPLRYGVNHTYQRQFGVDIPADRSSCGDLGCPVLVDFPGSWGTIMSQRGWTQWYRYLAKTDRKFILVTMQGSPDAVVAPDEPVWGTCGINDDPVECCTRIGADGDGVTSWNVLGWSNMTQPLELGGSAQGPLKASCIEGATQDGYQYGCWKTQLRRDPRSCKQRHGSLVAANCQSTTAANDWAYVRSALRFVTRSAACTDQGWCGDTSRIYFTGQSMGGMASLHFATPDSASPYHMAELRPAAVAACSPGGSLNNDLELRGMVPTLLMQGSRDEVAVPVPWAGYGRKSWYDGEYLRSLRPYKSVFRSRKWLKRAMAVVGLNGSLEALGRRRARRLMLLADTYLGGEFLERLADRAGARRQGGLRDRKGRLSGISDSGYMWEPIGTTIERVTGGRGPRMRDLRFETPAGISEQAEAIHMKCAQVQASPEVRFCPFDGIHTYPMLPNCTGRERDFDAFHDFIWKDWLREGGRRRQ